MDGVTETAAAPPPQPAIRDGGLSLWHLLAGILVALVLVYLPTLQLLVHNWLDDDDMGHGFFVPLVAGYLVWQKREELLRETYSPNAWGLLVVAYGAVQMLVAHLGVELFLSRTAFIISLAGCVLYLGGFKLLKKLAFPIGLLVFMVPIPAIIYNQITFPLQLLASRVAEWALSAIGIAVLREGNVLELPSQRLSVVEACSGIRSLLALSFLSLTYAAVFDPKRWMRPALLAVTIPIAISANAARVTLTGVLSEIDPELAKGLFHTMEGGVMYAISLALLFAAHKAINSLWGVYAARQS